ncbi:MAG: ATP-binding cassette domain-containing protein [Bacteroidia bacterium]|nr:ATP-binding cassette domain-containing protein [Bacteroidia bacterium]
MRRLFGLLATERRAIANIYLYAIINGLLNLSLPLGIQAILGFTLANTISTSWILLIIGVTVGTALLGIMQIMQLSITEMLQQKIFARSAFEFAYRIPRLRLEALFSYYPPELINRFFDTVNLQKGIPKILIDFSTALLQILFGLILLSFYHPFFVFFGFFLLALLVVIIRITGPMGLKTSMQESDLKYSVVFWLEELARTLKTFKLGGDSYLPIKKTDQLAARYIGARKQHFRVLIFQYGVIVGFKTIITAGLLILGSILLIEREINLGQFVASEIIIILIINSVEKLVLSADTVYDVLTSLEKLGKVTDLPVDRTDGMSFREVDRGEPMAVRMQHLSYTYPGDPNPSLSDLSLEAPAGSRICIVGENASGKTLVLNLLSGLYENFTGTLAYNHIPYGNYDPASLRGYIGDFLSQKVLFRGTLLENLTMARPEIKLEDVLWALDSLGLTEFVQTLPKGLDTYVAPEGPQWPESIVRKFILAKCIAKKPRLLVMDDLLGSLQPDDRKQVIDFLVSERRWTIIAVSNDPYLASRCDEVYVMAHGSVVDQGSFDEIRSRSYASRLFSGHISA